MSSRYDFRFLQALGAEDEKEHYLIRRDLSGGVNTQVHKSTVGDNQAPVLDNVDIGIIGKAAKRPGSWLIGDDVGSNSIVRLHNYPIDGETDQLLGYENTTLYKWIGSGNWTSLKADFTAPTTDTDLCMVSGKESGLTPDDVVFVKVDGNNWFRIDSDANEQDLGDTNTSPPLSPVGTWYGNRFWVLKNDLLYYSDAYSDDYSGAFDRTTNSFRLPVGDARMLAATRDLGIIAGGKSAIWALAPSATPATTDKPEPILSDYGIVSNQAWCVVGDDVWFFSHDGVRALKRTVQDKLQLGASFPLSHLLKDEFALVNWSYIQRVCMAYFDNKVFVTVPTGAATFDTWVFYPAITVNIPTKGSFPAATVINGWNARSYATYKVNGEERLYYGKHGDGTAYRAWNGYTDEGTSTTNGTKITYTIETKQEDLGTPLQYKTGGEVEFTFEQAGDYDVSVYASFDDGGYNLLGTVNLAGGGVSFPITFPVSFGMLNLVREKFHLDAYGRWRKIQLKIEHDATNGSDDIVLLEYNIVAFPDEYENE